MSATKAIIISAPKFIAAEPALEVTLSSSSSLVNSNICRTKTLKRTSFQCVSTMEKITCPPLPTTMLAVEANPTSSRKRRLDHLSIDEKIQRKKLKNRIAAQSSRDRKKAKMDELEMEVKELKDKVTSLVSQCSRLQGEVSRLAQENTSLRRQLSERRGSERASAESASGAAPARALPLALDHTPASASAHEPLGGAAAGGHGEDSLPPLLDLLDALDGDVALSQLEELASSLFAEALAHQEVTGAHGVATSDVEVVGPPSENLEPSGEQLKREVSYDQVPSPKDHVSLMETSDICSVSKSEPLLEPNTSLPEVFGTYDEDTQTVTILVPCDREVCIEDAVQEVVTCDSEVTLSSSYEEESFCGPPSSPSLVPSSPIGMYESESHVKPEHPPSDCGYESLDSPLSEISGSSDLNNVWNECFSELFPNLV